MRTWRELVYSVCVYVRVGEEGGGGAYASAEDEGLALVTDDEGALEGLV